MQTLHHDVYGDVGSGFRANHAPKHYYNNFAEELKGRTVSLSKLFLVLAPKLGQRTGKVSYFQTGEQ
jgi:hypothetical protein